MKTYVFFSHFSATKIHILFEPAILSSKIFLFLYSFLSIRQLSKYEKPPFYHKPFKPSPKMTKKNVRFHQSFFIPLISFYKSTFYIRFYTYFAPKKATLRVHYINQHITINQSITKIAKVPKYAFLQKTAQNSPFYPLSKTAISLKAQVVIISGFYFLVSMTKIEKPVAETQVSLSSKA